jgi:hypothetical protein
MADPVRDVWIFALSAIAAILLVILAYSLGRLLAGFRRHSSNAGEANGSETTLFVAGAAAVVAALLLLTIAVLSLSLRQERSAIIVANGGAPTSFKDIEDIIKDRLPDAQTRERQYQLLADAIRRPAPTQPPTFEAEVHWSAGVLLSVTVFSLAMLYVLASLYRRGLIGNRTLAVSLASTAALTGLTIGGVAVFKDTKIELFKISFSSGKGGSGRTAADERPVKIEISLQAPPGPPGERGSDGKDGRDLVQDIDCPASWRVGTFVVGSDRDFEDGETTHRALDKIAEEFEAKRRDNRLLALLLVGSADKTPLSPQRAREFGSNAGLAQARARWVQKTLGSRLAGLDAPGVVGLYAGPAGIGLTASKDALALDRSVQLCAFWASGPQRVSGGSAAP